MTRIVWGEGPRMFEMGLDRGVLYLPDSAIPWNGLVSVDESEVDVESTEHYFEGNRIHVAADSGAFQGKIEAYTYPDEFEMHSAHSTYGVAKHFGLSYRTQIDGHHRLHLIFDIIVRDSAKSWGTLKSSIDPSLFAWDIYASDVAIPGARSTSHLIIEAQEDSEALNALEDVLYGTETTAPRLPSPDEIVELYESMTTLRIRYLGDGVYSAEGPDDVVVVHPDGSFEINAPSVFFVDDDTFVVSSY